MGRPRKIHPKLFCEMCGEEIKPRIYYRKDGVGIHHIFQPKRFCSLSCTGKAGSAHIAASARGYYVDKHGYRILMNGKRGGYKQPEHRAVMEAHIGRALKPHETVHHKDGNRQNNALDNLELWSTRHGKGQRVADKIEFCIDFLREYGIEVTVPETVAKLT